MSSNEVMYSGTVKVTLYDDYVCIEGGEESFDRQVVHIYYNEISSLGYGTKPLKALTNTDYLKINVSGFAYSFNTTGGRDQRRRDESSRLICEAIEQRIKKARGIQSKNSDIRTKEKSYQKAIEEQQQLEREKQKKEEQKRIIEIDIDDFTDGY